MEDYVLDEIDLTDIIILSETATKVYYSAIEKLNEFLEGKKIQL